MAMYSYGTYLAKVCYRYVTLLQFLYFFRANNPKYGKRYVELKKLPDDYYTPMLKKLKAEGKLNLDSESSGCKI